MEKDFELQKDGTTLNIVLGKELSTANSGSLKEELSKYCGQGIDEVIFDATGLLFLTSSGLRTVFFAHQNLGGHPRIVFVNCASQIYEVLDHVGLASFVRFEENQERRKQYRKSNMNSLSIKEIDQIISERKKTLEQFSANNDVVCYSMKMRKEEE